MEIVYLGHSSFRLSTKTVSVVMDPFDPQFVGLRFSKVSSTVVTVSHSHADHARADLVSGVKKVLSEPGEYEIEGVSFIGISSYHDQEQGAKRGPNTIFVVEMDSLRIVHLGDLGHQLSESTQNAIGEVDVLMVPVGGEYTLGPQEAAELVRSIEPRITIPMHFQVDGLSANLKNKLQKVDPFLSALGFKVEKLPKLKINGGNLPAEDQLIVLLEKK